MGGLVLDIIVVFLFRITRRVFRELQSRNWPSLMGAIKTSEAPSSAMYSYAEIIYSYTVTGETYTGTYVRGFWDGSTAERFARKFGPKQKILVSYDPLHPMKSFLRDRDLHRQSRDDR